MAHMTLPAAHSEADARLAERIGRALELEEVHVFWTYPMATVNDVVQGSPDPAAVQRGGLVAALAAVIDRIVPQRR